MISNLSCLETNISTPGLGNLLKVGYSRLNAIQEIEAIDIIDRTPKAEYRTQSIDSVSKDST